MRAARNSQAVGGDIVAVTASSMASSASVVHTLVSIGRVGGRCDSGGSL